MSALWMVVDHGVASGTGYSRRVLFELELLSAHIEPPILIYPSGVEIPGEFDQLCVQAPIQIGKPLAVHARTLKRELYRLAAQKGLPEIIYCQNLMASYAAMDFAKENKINLILDYHGAVPTEIRQTQPGMRGLIKGAMAYLMERRITKAASLVITVSEYFRDYLGLVTQKSIVMPMLPASIFTRAIPTHPLVTREQLGIAEGATVFCYLGQAQAWQLPAETVDLYSRFEKARSTTHLLIVTRDVDVFRMLAQKAGIRNYTILSAAHADVPNYLQLCDYGFVLRDPSLINRVASPTKVLEYLSCGVIPVITKYVGDFSTLLAENNLGVHVDLEQLHHSSYDVPSEFDRPSVDQRAASREFVQLFRAQYLERYIETLKTLIGRGDVAS